MRSTASARGARRDAGCARRRGVDPVRKLRPSGAQPPEAVRCPERVHERWWRGRVQVDDPASELHDCVDRRHDSLSRASGAKAHRAAAAHCRRYGQTIAVTIPEETLTELRAVRAAFDVNN